MKTKSFDCVEMKRKGSQMIHERLKGKTVEEQIAFWQERNEQFRKEANHSLNAVHPSPKHNS